MARKSATPAAAAPAAAPARFVHRNPDTAWWFGIPHDTRALYIKMWAAYYKRPIHLMDPEFQAFILKQETKALHAELLA